MVNMKELCIFLFVLGFIAVASGDPFIGHLRFHLLSNYPCLFKRCHRYAKCEVQKNKAVCVCPKVCPKNLAPVCGTDWKTYNNFCELTSGSCLANSRTRRRYSGSCKSGSCRRTRWKSLRCPYYSRCELNYGLPRCLCPQETCPSGYNPVCGSDDRTYRNSCELRKSACKQRKWMYIQHPGHCRPDPCALIDCCCNAQCQVNETSHARCVCNFACTLQYDPVCGSDGRTYGNACGLRSAACAKQNPQLRVVSNGECPTTGSETTTGPETTTSPFVPTTLTPCARIKCGFFANCEVRNGSVACVCPSLCPSVFKPVCGSNGVSYTSICELRRDSCKKQHIIEFVNNGPCQKNTTNPVTTQAPTTVTPCATIKCGFFAKCEVKNGSAGCVCPDICLHVNNPMCGSDGVTYGNLCELEKASCKQQKHITVVKRGRCGPTLSCPIPKVCHVFCDKDECVKRGQICCCRGCGNVCTTPIKQFGRDVCPPDENSCLLDSGCPSGKKCCLDGCTKRCVSPVVSL